MIRDRRCRRPLGAARPTTAVGSPHPLGPTVRSDGVNFSVFSQNATGIELLLFESELSARPFQSIQLDLKIHRTFGFWHVLVEGLQPGAIYGYRVDGPFDLSKGHRFDPSKVAIYPYARGHTLALWIAARPVCPATMSTSPCAAWLSIGRIMTGRETPRWDIRPAI